MSIQDCFLIDTKLHLIKPYASFGKYEFNSSFLFSFDF